MGQKRRPGISMRTSRPLPCAVSAAAAAGTCPTAAPMPRSCGPATCAGSLGTAAGSAPTVRTSSLALHALSPCMLIGSPHLFGILIHYIASIDRLLMPDHFACELLQRSDYECDGAAETPSCVPLQCCASSAISQATLPAIAQAGRSLPSSWQQSACDAAAQTALLPKQGTMSGAVLGVAEAGQ